MASWNRERQDVLPDPRPEKRVKAGPAEWEAIRARFEYATCVNCGLAAQSLHHILPKSQGGDDVFENLAPLCGDGTRGCHGLLESHSPGWERVAAAVRQYVITDPGRRRYQDENAPGFSRRYPVLANMDAQFEADLDHWAEHWAKKSWGSEAVEGWEKGAA